MLTILQEEQFENLYQLMEDSFPVNEHRGYQAQRALLSHPLYQAYIYENNQELGAFFTTWEGPDFIYLEHFAVKENLRNDGLGSKLLQVFLQQQKSLWSLKLNHLKVAMKKDELNFMYEMALALVSGAMFNQNLQKGKALFQLY